MVFFLTGRPLGCFFVGSFFGGELNGGICFFVLPPTVDRVARFLRSVVLGNEITGMASGCDGDVSLEEDEEGGG